jgi:hypothetical protein
MNTYKSFAPSHRETPEYDHQHLVSDGYVLKVSCDKENPDCEAYIADKKKEGCFVEIVEHTPKNSRRVFCDIWVKDNNIVK